MLETHGVRTLKWPAQSPDLNPIENLWAILKQRRQQKYGIPMSRDELIEQMQDIWQNLDKKILDNLNSSMKNRLKEVLKKKRDVIDY